ncbi:hypothetical protein PV11_00304 [Exophiala sideris]|uniref:Uncharacterized protein n=1 Tax=Exophiala sideris TaxID=1016849 RepID=A0A0D1W792_9EURO|nr:hypothetical protein PV11_00304 [Exophiala sideris]
MSLNTAHLLRIYMQLDSHRRQSSFTMPCPWSRRCKAASENDALPVLDSPPSPTTATDTLGDWKHLRTIRRSVRHMVLLMALMKTIRVLPMTAYTIGYFLSWLYLCAFWSAISHH